MPWNGFLNSGPISTISVFIQLVIVNGKYHLNNTSKGHLHDRKIEDGPVDKVVRTT